MRAASLSLSGTQTITPGSLANASDDLGAWQSEMSISVNPTNPLNLVGISHHIFEENNDFNRNALDVFYSTNGGAS